MAITNTSKFTSICLIAACSIGGLVACNNSDYRSSDTSDSTAINSAKVATADSTAAADSAATAAIKKAKKKGRASVLMSGNGDMATKGTMTMDKEGVYSNVQVMPEFPGGQNALATYVNNHVEYPQQAIDDNATGTVKVSFVVDENGKIANARLLDNNSKLGKGLDEEALRVVNNMPTWKPGKVKGKNVKTRLELPITFQFES